MDHRLRPYRGKIVAVERDINRADWDFHAGRGSNCLRQALGKRNATAADADQREVFRATTFLTISWAKRWRVRPISSAERSRLFSTTRIFAPHPNTESRESAARNPMGTQMGLSCVLYAALGFDVA